ncbi:MBF2 protein, partial [Danaus plexippus plexippus]
MTSRKYFQSHNANLNWIKFGTRRN